MAVVLYWKERLLERQPLRDEGLRTSTNVQAQETDTWPRAVAKQALWADYQMWCDDVWLPPFLDTDYFKDFPDQAPKPANELEFFTTLSPFLHLVGRAQQTRARMVWSQVPFEDKWVRVKVRRNFVRLCNWKEHAAAFELLTGQSVGAELAPDTMVRARETLAGAVQVTIARIASNRAALPEAMGKR